MANVIEQLPSGTAGFTVIAAGVRTSQPNTFEYEVQGRGYEYRGLVLVLDLTAFTTAASLQVTISGVDRVSGKIYTILQSAVIAANGTTVLKVAPGITASANVAAADCLPPIFRISCAQGNANSHTYSLAGMLV